MVTGYAQQFFEGLSGEKQVILERFPWIRNRSWRELIRQRWKNVPSDHFSIGYCCYDGLMVFIYHLVLKFYRYLLPAWLFWIRNEAWTDLAILVIAGFLIHTNQELGLIYNDKCYFCIQNIHKHCLYAILTSYNKFGIFLPKWCLLSGCDYDF